MCMNSFLLCIHNQSVLRNVVTLWKGKDIPAGIPHELEGRRFFASIGGSWTSFLFSWIKWSWSPVGIFLLTCTSNDDGVCPLIRPDGYKGLVMILPTKPFSCSPDRATRASLFVFRERRTAPARQILPIMTSKVKSERILRNLARPKPFVSTAFEGVGSCFSRIACPYIFIAREGGRTIYITYSVKRGCPFRIIFPP